MDQVANVESQDSADDDYFQEVQRVCNIRNIAKNMTPLSGLRLMKELAGSLTPSPGPGDKSQHGQSTPLPTPPPSSVQQSDGKNDSSVNANQFSTVDPFFNFLREGNTQNDQSTSKVPSMPRTSNFRLPPSCLQPPSFSSALQSPSGPSKQQKFATKCGKSSQMIEAQRWMREYFREKRLRQKLEKETMIKEKKYAKLKRKSCQPVLFNLNMTSIPEESEKKSRRKSLSEQVIDCITSPVCIFPLAQKKPTKGSNSEDLFANSGNSSLGTASGGDKQKNTVVNELPPLSDKAWEEISKTNTPKFFSIFNRHKSNYKENSQPCVRQPSDTDTQQPTQRDSGIGSSDYSSNSSMSQSSLSLCSSYSPSIASSCGPPGEFSWRMTDTTEITGHRAVSIYSQPNVLKTSNNVRGPFSNTAPTSKSSLSQIEFPKNAFPSRGRRSSSSNTTTSKRLPLASLILPSVPVFNKNMNTWSSSNQNYQSQSRSQPF